MPNRKFWRRALGLKRAQRAAAISAGPPQAAARAAEVVTLARTTVEDINPA